MGKHSVHINDFEIIFIGIPKPTIPNVVPVLDGCNTRSELESLLECLSEDEFKWKYEINETDRGIVHESHS